MRRLVLLALPFLALSGCFGHVVSDPPTTGCGTDSDPLSSQILASEVSWAGRNITALEDGVKVWIAGNTADAPTDWWGAGAKAWAIVAHRLGAAGDIVEARAGLATYDGKQTRIAINDAGHSQFDETQMLAGFEALGPIPLAKDETLFIAGAADAPVSTLGLVIRWTGCASTDETAWGSVDGFALGWPQMEGKAIFENAATGAVAYEGRIERTTGSGIVLAKPPPGQDATGQNEAKVTTSAGTTSLEGLRFFGQGPGKVTYELTHIGEPGDEPLVAYVGLALPR